MLLPEDVLRGDEAVGSLSADDNRDATTKRDGSDPDLPVPDQEAWRKLDDDVRSAWDAKLRHATENEVTDAQGTGMRFLPFPFVTTFDVDGDAAKPMFAWDTYFVDRALLAHGRLDLVRDHIRNYLFMVDRYGYMPNMNNDSGVTRSQTPVYPDGIWRYYLASSDIDILFQAYPLLKREYRDYWNAPHHQTPIGLTTNRDLGDQGLTPQMAAEAETGLDWTPIYTGDVRRCVPLITNCALVRYARVLELIARELGRDSEASEFADEASTRTELIRKYCWSEKFGLFVEYDFVSGSQLSYVSGCTYWPMWAGVATPPQAYYLAHNLKLLECRYGLALTDHKYGDPHPKPSSADLVADLPKDAVGGLDQLQWMYPAGWACMQLAAVEGLDMYGYPRFARRIASRFLAAVVEQHEKTGKLWEKYNVLDGTVTLPNSRYGNSPYLSWTAAAGVLLGRRLFSEETHYLRSERERLANTPAATTPGQEAAV
ncbi:trehalase family glycosidase [Phytoactinopolyspora halotolerans]|uniref:Alpha,alpha-trehalase n=1 Tax=Phytoactinopolyspora halotolerans TaxID=1981512 RepID=A0A6L9SFC6_9ACTN|nr:trehalase family glycosidase [Phytoactinopolyspora halotolerans]NEE03916.1 hypothetical protein [Phytoactinopolyspora halotolerans]